MLAVIKNGLQQITANDIREAAIATPVPIRGGLLVRGAKHLFWVAKAEK